MYCTPTLSTKAEQDTLDTKQQNIALQRQIRLQVQRAEERATTAEERASRAEKELLEVRQQNYALQQQIRQVQQPKEIAIRIEDKNSDYMKSPWRVRRDEIQVIEEEPLLGVREWGEVRAAMFHGVRVAAKFLHESIISPHNIDLLFRKINMAASVQHPNIVQFIGASLDYNKPVILIELIPINLRSIIETPGRTFTRGHVISVSTDVARGLNYLHLMRPDPIIHRDVNSANVLLESIGSGNWKAKICDFGGSADFLSKVLTPGPGNACYAAPESFNPNLQSPKMDVYSYGILLLEMATGKFPNHSLQAMQLYTLLWKEIAIIIRRCICKDPANRPTMGDVLMLLPQLKK